jgi:hypothetical protein
MRPIPLALLLLASCAGAPKAPPIPEHPGSDWKERMERAARSPEAWRARSEDIRRQILVSAGLWPELDRGPVKAEIFDRRERDGYTVEKILIETLPGFQLAGNLYRPLGKQGPFPGIASPHGHWKTGRFTDNAEASMPGRALTLARMGCVVLNYDMVGYADTTQVPHQLEDKPWAVSLLGLQLWNSLKVVDFLASLPDVDPERLGCTGASGGGTQTFILAAVDPRIQVSVPVNMVAAGCQGGCSCENSPLLRIDLNNVEIAASIAPRALLMMACTGDWTSDVPTLEGPFVASIYEKLGAKGKFRWAQVKADHNYNRETREIVYAWFSKHLLGGADVGRIPEPPFQPEKREDLSVRPRPPGPADGAAVAEWFRARFRQQIDQAPSRAKHEGFREGLTASLGARWPSAGEVEARAEGDVVRLRYRHLPGEIELKKVGGPGPLVVVGSPSEAASVKSPAWLLVLPEKHEREAHCSAGVEIRNKGWVQWRENFPATYYRTETARKVQDVLTALAYVGAETKLVGKGPVAGPIVVLARAVGPHGPTVEDPGPDPDHPGLQRLGGLLEARILAGTIED